jgi:hypothetical protein
MMRGDKFRCRASDLPENDRMRRLYIHCGLAKTGTTSLQDYLAQRRAELLTLGVGYPAVGVNKRGVAQQNLTIAILQEDGGDVPDGGRQELIETLRASDRAPNVVISSESFSACIGNKRARPKFLDFIRQLRELNDEVYAVFTVRTFWKHMESSYLERLKKGKPRKDISDQIQTYTDWLESLCEGLTLLGEEMGENCVIALDVEYAFPGSIDAMLSTLGLNADLLPPRTKSLNVRLSLKKSAYLYQFQYDPCGTHNNRPKAEITSIASMLKRIPDFRADEMDYHLLSSDDANRIQSLAREKMPPYLADSLKKLTAPVTEPFEAIDLGAIRFTERDRKVIRKVRARFGR